MGFSQLKSAIGNPQSAIIGFVQAGGRSSRMGADKAWLEIEGRPMIERSLATAKPIVKSLAIIINAANPQTAKYEKLAESLNAKIIQDLHDHRGPLGGIHTALVNCEKDESALILACDLPFVTTEFLSLLSNIHQNPQSAIRNPQSAILNPQSSILNPQSAIRNPQSITLPVDQEGRLQPLAGIYAASCLPAVEQMLAQEMLRVDRLCSRVPTRRVLFEEFAHLPAAERFFININTLEDFQKTF